MLKKFESTAPAVLLSPATYNEIISRIANLEAKHVNSRDSNETMRELMVQNKTNTNIPPFHAVQIGDPVILPGSVTGDTNDTGYRFQHVFCAEETDEDSDMIGITQVGLPADVGNGTGGTGKIITEGVTTAVVNVTDMNHGYAQPSATTGVLESTAEETPIRIMYKQMVGEQHCKVIIGGTSTGYRTAWAQAPDAGIASNADADFEIAISYDGGNEVGDTVTVSNTFSTTLFETGSHRGTIGSFDGETWFIINEDRECE